MKFTRFPKYKPKGITPRRLNNATKALNKQREALPLLTDWVAQSQPTAEERIVNFDIATVNYWQRLRNNRAEDWRKVRAILRNHPCKKAILSHWNNSNYPKEPCYLLGLINQYSQ